MQHKHMENDPILWRMLWLVFPLSSLAGIAAVLKSGEAVVVRDCVGAALWSGICGLATAMILFHNLGAGNLFLIYGVSISSGLGGASAIDFANELRKKLR